MRIANTMRMVTVPTNRTTAIVSRLRTTINDKTPNKMNSFCTFLAVEYDALVNWAWSMLSVNSILASERESNVNKSAIDRQGHSLFEGAQRFCRRCWSTDLLSGGWRVSVISKFDLTIYVDTTLLSNHCLPSSLSLLVTNTSLKKLIN